MKTKAVVTVILGPDTFEKSAKTTYNTGNRSREKVLCDKEKNGAAERWLRR